VKNLIGLGLVAIVLFTAAFACNMSTANISSLKTMKEKDGADTTTYKAGDTIYANATVSNNGGKVTVRMYLQAEDAPGVNMKKGDMVPNSETKLELDGDGVAKYSYPTYATTKGGKFNVVAEMMNSDGEKKDSKSVTITVEPGNASAPVTDDKKTSSDDDK
jgi:hypothetical protein